MCAFHLEKYNKHLEHIPNPAYMGVTLDGTLSCNEHIHKLKCKPSARNNILRKLSNTKWGPSQQPSKQQLLHSATYGGICVSCVGKVETRKQTWSSSERSVPLLNRMAETNIRRECISPCWYCTTWCQKVYHISKKKKRRKQTEDPRHCLYSHEPVNKHLKSRNSFLHPVTPLDTNSPAERLRALMHHLRSVPQKLKSIPSEDLGP